MLTMMNVFDTDRRSNVYSDRPRFIMGSEILTGGMLIAFLGYGDR